MRRPVSVGFLFVALAAVAAPPAHERVEVDDQPTDFACNFVSLVSGETCAFEAAKTRVLLGKDEQAKQNRGVVTETATKGCKDAAKVGVYKKLDKVLLARCMEQLAPTVEDVCNLDGSGTLVDTEGRFGPSGKDCYEAMQDFLASVRTFAGTSESCCACLARSCSTPEAQCHHTRASAQVGRSCASSSCAVECGLTPPAEEPAQPRLNSPVKDQTPIRKGHYL